MLNTPKLQLDIKALLSQMQREEDAEQAAERYAEQLAKAIDEFVRSGQVQTTGTAAAQTGKIV